MFGLCPACWVPPPLADLGIYFVHCHGRYDVAPTPGRLGSGFQCACECAQCARLDRQESR